jgi:hypothetical protein
MKNAEIQIILAEIAEQAAPSAEIDLWPEMCQRLTTSEAIFQQGDTSMKTGFFRTPLLRRAALVLLAIVIAFAILLATPQGQAFAQNVLKFFTRAESDTLPVQPFQQTPIPTLSPESTPEKPFPLTIDAAQTLAGYKVFVPTDTKDHNFYGAEYDPVRKTVSINYSDPEIGFGNGFLITEQLLTVSPDIYPLQGVVGASAPVEPVQIGSLPGEYVMGVWNLTDNGPVWEPEPFLQTLRWKTDTTFFEIVYEGAKLTKADLLAIAESLK